MVKQALVMQQRHPDKTAMDANVIFIAGLFIQPVDILRDQPCATRPAAAISCGV